MRVVLHVSKLLVILLVAWLLVLIFFTGPLLKNNESEEALARNFLIPKMRPRHIEKN